VWEKTLTVPPGVDDSAIPKEILIPAKYNTHSELILEVPGPAAMTQDFELEP
jgi:hypothetical protein